jgi:hypothetical protein
VLLDLYIFKEEYKMFIVIMITLQLIIFIFSLFLVYLLVRKHTRECFYIKDEILHLNSLLVKKIPLSDIDYVEFDYFHVRSSYSGLIKIYKKNSKIIRRYFQTSQVTFFATEKMVLNEIKKITTVLKKYSIPYTVTKK